MDESPEHPTLAPQGTHSTLSKDICDHRSYQIGDVLKRFAQQEPRNSDFAEPKGTRPRKDNVRSGPDDHPSDPHNRFDYIASRDFREVRAILANGSIKTEPSRRKSVLKRLFRSHSKMPLGVRLQETSQGHKYGQIVIDDLYESKYNDSLYYLPRAGNNQAPMALLRTRHASDLQTRHADDFWSKMRPTPKQEHAGNGKSLELFKAANTPINISATKPHQGLREPLDDTIQPMKRDSLSWMRLPKIAPSVLKLPLSDGTSLSAGELTRPGSSTSPNRVSRSETHPSLRIINRHTSVVGPSHNPPKKRGGHKWVPSLQGDQKNSPCMLGINTIRDSPSPNLVTPFDPLVPQQATNPPPTLQPSVGEKIFRAATPVTHGHSQTPSAVSAVSNAEEYDTSEFIISDAQSVSMSSGVPRRSAISGPARPAPTTPLPPLPEGQQPNPAAPATPRASESSRRGNSPERSPTKAVPRSPGKYNVMPPNGSPRKKPGSPERKIAAIGPTRTDTNDRPAVKVTVHNMPSLSSFPQPPPSPTRDDRNATTVEYPEQEVPKSMNGDAMQQPRPSILERTVKTKQRKGRVTAQQRSLNSKCIEIYKDDPFPAGEAQIVQPETRYEGVVELPPPSPGKAHEPQPTSPVGPLYEQPRANPPNNPSATHVRKSPIPLLQISPIIPVAEQFPIPFPLPSPNKPTNLQHSPIPLKTNNTDHVAPPSRLLSSLPPSNTNPLPRSISTRTPTPFTHPLLRPQIQSTQSTHSSARSSLIEQQRHSLPHSDTGLEEYEAREARLEARLAAVERANSLLVEAFTAVVRLGGGVSGDGNGEEGVGRWSGSGGSRGSGNGNGSGNGMNGNGGVSEHDGPRGEDVRGGDARESAEGESLYAGLEGLLLRHRGPEGGRVSACSGS